MSLDSILDWIQEQCNSLDVGTAIAKLSIVLLRKVESVERKESIDVKIEGPYHDGDGEVEGHHGAQDGHHVVRLHELDIALVFGNLTSNKNICKILLIKIFKAR